jgi:hypothetical protein
MTFPEGLNPAGPEAAAFVTPRIEGTNGVAAVNGVDALSTRSVKDTSELPAAGQVRELFFAGTSPAAKLEAARIQMDASSSRSMVRRTNIARR